MPLIQIKIPCSVATQKRILYDFGHPPIVVLKRNMALYQMVCGVDVQDDTTVESGITFQFHSPAQGNVDKATVGTILDRHYTQLRNELIGMHCNMWDDTLKVTHALLQYNGEYGIETDIDITLETMQRSWTRWCQAERERKTMLHDSISGTPVHTIESRSIVSEMDIHVCIETYIHKYRYKFLKKIRHHGINPERVFELSCYIYRMVGFNNTFIGSIFGRDRMVCRKAAERFKYRLLEWRKQGIEPPSLES